MTKTRIVRRNLIFAALVTIALIFYVVQSRHAKSNLISGGTGTHMLHSEGIILEISDDIKEITVELKQTGSDTSFANFEEIYLDYSKVQQMDELNIGDTVVFYYFGWDIDKAKVKVQYIIQKEAIHSY